MLVFSSRMPPLGRQAEQGWANCRAARRAHSGRLPSPQLSPPPMTAGCPAIARVFRSTDTKDIFPHLPTGPAQSGADMRCDFTNPLMTSALPLARPLADHSQMCARPPACCSRTTACRSCGSRRRRPRPVAVDRGNGERAGGLGISSAGLLGLNRTVQPARWHGWNLQQTGTIANCNPSASRPAQKVRQNAQAPEHIPAGGPARGVRDPAAGGTGWDAPDTASRGALDPRKVLLSDS